MTEERQRPVDEEGEPTSVGQPAPSLEASQEVNQQDPLPYLHDLSQGLPIAAHVVEALMNPQGVGAVDSSASVADASRQAPRNVQMLHAAQRLIWARLRSV